MRELLAGLTESGFGELAGFERLLVQHLEEPIELILKGTLDQVHQKEDQFGKGQFAFAGEMLRFKAVALGKLRRGKCAGYILYNFQRT
ncbi:MAG: hypothetical protein DSY85_09135 [Marinomonas sp.]|nr:MAG: hypothetical protein DSY85_09135 [Marinomonas sp.]